jgi:RHS repeat-associated protein
VGGLLWCPSRGGGLAVCRLTCAQYTQTFAYDTRNRLSAVTSSGATGSSPGSYIYGDAAHVDAATATAGGYSATYDAAGDMLCRAPTSTTTCTGSNPTGATLAYDAERRLNHSVSDTASPPTVEAWSLYDGEGNRVEQDVSLSGGAVAKTFYLPKGVEEMRSDGSLVKYYTAGGLALGLNTAHDASGITFLGSDGLGSMQVALNSSGVAISSQLFAPYGGVRYANGTMPTAKGFTGQYSDAATSGLDYYNARYYDPALGQFTSADSQADGLNHYGYVKGNPETATDPSGHRRCFDDGCVLIQGDSGASAANRGSTKGHSQQPQATSLPPWRWSLVAMGVNLAAVGGTYSWLEYSARAAAQKAATPTQAVSGYVKANGTVVEPYLRRLPGFAARIADAKYAAQFARIAGYSAIAVGALIDGVIEYSDYYASEDANDPERQEKAIVAGVMHAVISTAVTVAFIAAVTAIPIVGQMGILQVGAGIVGGMAGGWVASQLVNPTTVDAVTNGVNGVGNVATSVGNQLGGAANTIGNFLGGL